MLFLATMYLFSPKLRSLITGLAMLLLISASGAKLKLIPIRLHCLPTKTPNCFVSSILLALPNTKCLGKTGVLSKRMLKPHSPSMPINRGTLEIFWY